MCIKMFESQCTSFHKFTLTENLDFVVQTQICPPYFFVLSQSIYKVKNPFENTLCLMDTLSELTILCNHQRNTWQQTSRLYRVAH